jgi:hypothetical protein
MFPESSGRERYTSAMSGSLATTPVLLAQYAELLETVWACERTWRIEDRIDLAVRYGIGR